MRRWPWSESGGWSKRLSPRRQRLEFDRRPRARPWRNLSRYGPGRDAAGALRLAEQRRLAEEADLRDSLASLSRLASGNLELESLLTRVATYAVQAIPGADGAGLTLLEQDRADTVVATAPFVSEIDDIQYGIGQGPCISAAADGRPVLSGSLGVTRAGRGSAGGSPGSGCTAWCRCR